MASYASPPYYSYADAPASPLGRGFYAAPSPRHYTSHSRHASHDVSGNSSPAGNYPSPRYSSSGRYATRTGVQQSPFGTAEYVSDRPRTSHHTRYHHSKSHSRPFSSRYRPDPFRSSFEVSDEDEVIDVDGVQYVFTREPKTNTYYRGADTNHHYAQGFTYDRDGTPIITVDQDAPVYETPRRSHTRYNSTSTPQRPSTARPSSSKKQTPIVIPQATEADARAHRIPAGYSLKNWDPTEEPILLLGSVFDANSLGKWIYDWTVYRHGPATPISDVAGELWLLLIKLAGKIKRSDECLPRVRQSDNRQLIIDFIESGERLMDKLKKLLKACEGPMLKAGRKSKEREPSQLGKNAGVEFVETMFGRDRMLDSTEKFMTSIRLWNMRFDANCEDILRNPTI